MLVVALSLVFAGTAFAYQIVYYFGSYSNPVRISNGTAGTQTSGTAFRLFNEAWAKQSGCGSQGCGFMNNAKLFYNSTLIGQGNNTFYFRVYQNGPNSHAGCQITNSWSLGFNAPSWVWCDAAYS